jgi:putative acetyltransferase
VKAVIAIRKGTVADEAQLKELYRRVAAVPGGLARSVDEVTDAFMHDLVENAVHKGMLFVAESARKPVGMLVVYPVGPQSLAHVLKDVTVLVDPDFQGQGIGSRLLTTLQSEIQEHRPDIMRVELFTRETNPALALYKRLGFVQEGRFEGRIKNPDGSFVADIAMVWRNPHFKD